MNRSSEDGFIAVVLVVAVLAYLNSKKSKQATSDAWTGEGTGSFSGSPDDNVVISTWPVTPFNLPVTDPQSNQVPNSILSSVLNAPVGNVNGPSAAGIGGNNPLSPAFSNPTNDPVTDMALTGASIF